MNILISGSSGFVGSHVRQVLLQQGHVVTRLERNGIGADLLQWNTIDNAALPTDLDHFIHLAGKAHDLAGHTKLEDYISINVHLTQKLFLRFVQHPRAEKFIYFSSVKAVADSVSSPLMEDDLPCPKTYYGISKLMAEEFLMSAELPRGKQIFILRPCIIHGPGNKGNLTLLFNLVKKGIPYPLGAFENQRSFLSVDNLCFAITAILKGHIAPSVYNIADDTPMSTNDLIGIISTSLGRQPKIIRLPQGSVRALAKIGDVLRLPLNSSRLKKLTEDYVVSNSKLISALGQTLPLSCAEGLKRTFESFRDA